MLLAALAMGGCASEEPSAPETAVASIVTYESTSGGTSVFSYTDGNDETVTLTGSWSGRDDIAPGSRMLIHYRTQAYGVSGPIELISIMPVPGGNPETADAGDITPSEPLGRCVMWRSGQYLNLSATVSFAGKARKVALCVDASTAGLPQPTAHVVVTAAADSPVGSAERQLYASWNIASILEAPANEGLKVVYTDSRGNESEIIISNNNITP